MVRVPAIDPLIEKAVIEQLRGYKRIVGRIKILERYPIGNGMYLPSFAQDDNLQALHRKLRGQPSYMYLNKHELQLETVAHVYLDQYPVGTRSQLRAVKEVQGLDDEDSKLLAELARKIKKVYEARRGTVDGFEAALERVSELQELQDQKSRLDETLNVLEWYKPRYCQLLKLRYIEEKSVDEAADAMNVAPRTLERWRPRAIKEYAGLAGLG
jgi:DNA-directed RNA polymerase specialized sigma24 family protein